MRMLSLLVLAACNGGDFGGVTEIDSRFVVPDLVDAGDVAVGDEREFTVRLSSEFGAGQLFQVDVLNLDDEAFSWQGDPVDIRDREFADIPLVFAPTSATPARAIVTFALRGDDDEGSVEMMVRGRGVALNVARWPSIIDFGPVPVQSSVVRQFDVANDGLLPVDIIDADVDGTGFSLDQEQELPLTIPAGGTLELDVRFGAANTLASQGDITLTLQDGTTLAPVELRANDCAMGAAQLYDADDDGWTSCAGDCDDNNASVYPGAIEVLDGVDNNCNGLAEEDTAAYDDDGDGFTERQGDCNDSAFLVNPGRTEIMGDGIDNDCDGVADLGSDDVDGDGYSPAAGDCNDRNSAVHPGASELADGTDNDCDDLIDEGTRLADDDGDGYCESVADACSDGALGGDCSDGSGVLSAEVHPGALEIADGIDNDCDGFIDEGTARGDDDGDGFTENGGDCNDADARIHPGRYEVPGNGLDDDCNASTPD